MGSIERLWVKRVSRGPMDPVSTGELVAGRGLVGNANQGGRRQVTLIARERWNELERTLGASIDPSARRANVLVSGIDLEDSIGRVIRLGACRLRILGETRPCERMDEAFPGLRDAMRERWGGGAFAEVLDGGIIRVGDEAGWELTQ